MTSCSRPRWIAVDVAILEDPLFEGEPYTRREALLWLYANVAWKETRHRVGSATLPVPVGSVFVTLRTLQKHWGWRSDTRVRAFLKEMEREGKICVQTDAGKTLISLCDHSVFQAAERSENAAKTQKKRSGNAQKTPRHKDSEKERMREDDSDLNGFKAWFEAYPTGPYDNREVAEAEWRKLTPEERRTVINDTPGYFEDAAARGRDLAVSAGRFLSGRYWARKRDPQPYRKGKQTGRQAAGKTMEAAVASTPKTREELIRQNLEHNAKSWEGRGRDLGQPSKFLSEYARMQAEKQLAPERSEDASMVDQGRGCQRHE